MRFERTFEKDLEHIRKRISHMAALGEKALRKCLEALKERNRQIAYTVILGDRGIDEMERELDQLCLEFLVRQQPVASPLRFAYSTIRVNLELERIGDYAESIARQILKILAMNVEFPTARFVEIGEQAIPMLHDAVHAFVTQDAELAKRTMVVEEAVDVLRNTINQELYQLRQTDKIPLEALTPLITIARRFERVSDQAKNICQEVIYSTTGEYTRHQEEATFRVLFVDEDDSCRAQMAAGIGNSFNRANVVFDSAGLQSGKLDQRAVSFLSSKGIDISNRTPKTLNQIDDLQQYHVVIGLAHGIDKSLPPPPRKTVYLDWNVSDPTVMKGKEDENRAYELTYNEIRGHVRDLLEAIVGEDLE